MDGKRVELIEREAGLMLYLMLNEGRPLSRTDIFDALWQSQGGVAINVVNVYMGYLRRKLATLSGAARDSIRTVRGKGFMFSHPD
jgi:DNA-binding response OmpR family regulator